MLKKCVTYLVYKNYYMCLSFYENDLILVGCMTWMEDDRSNYMGAFND